MVQLFITWFILINLTGFTVCAVDKYKARRGKWRIPEKTLFGIALIGGAAGVYLSLLLFRHKTRHLRFMLGIPLILVIHAGIALYLYRTGL